MITKETARMIIAASKMHDQLRDHDDPQLEKLADNATDEAIECAVFDGFDPPDDFFWLITSICNGSCSATTWLSEHETEDY